MAGNAASRVLGLGREVVIAGLFGLSASASAFATAATVPTMVYDLLVGGAISAALIPVLSGLVPSTTDDRRLARFGQVAGALLGLTILVATVVVIVLEIAAPLVVAALGAAARPELEAETTLLVRLVVPSIVLLAASGVVQAAVQARGLFHFAAISAAAFNAGIIVCGLILAGALGPAALALGVLVGTGLQLLVLSRGLRGVPIGLSLDFRLPLVRQALMLYAPVAAGLAVSQAAIVVDRYLANMTGEQSVALMRTATTLVQLPLGLVATALSFAVLPALSREESDGPAFRRTLAFGVRLALLAMVPITVGLVLLREPVVRLLFERGAFGPADTALTAAAFVWYAPQMPFWAVDQLLIFAFYARRDTITPVVVGLVGTLLYLVVALTVVGSLGVFGLILANTVQNSAHAVVMYVLLVRRGFSLRGHGVEGLLARALIATALAAAAHSALSAIVGPAPSDAAGNLAWLVLVAGVMAVVAIGSLAATRTTELTDLLRVARGRFER